MTQRKNAACAAIAVGRSPESSGPDSSVETYGLRTRREANEAQNLDGQKLVAVPQQQPLRQGARSRSGYSLQMRIAKKSEPAWLAGLLAHCHVKRYDKNVQFIRQNDPADSLYYLVEGSVAALVEDEQQREIVLAYINKGEFIGEMGLFTPEPLRSIKVRSRTKCQVAEITYKKLERLLDGELRDSAKDLLFAIGYQLSERLRSTSSKVGHLAFLVVTGRIARTLLDLCKEPDAMTHPDGMQIRITRQEIGRIVGCSREMAGRVLKSLAEQGLISASGKTIVVFGTR
jgi:CRP/FNR family cyclic AMP-dependent transcriptional regulator